MISWAVVQLNLMNNVNTAGNIIGQRCNEKIIEQYFVHDLFKIISFPKLVGLNTYHWFIISITGGAGYRRKKISLPSKSSNLGRKRSQQLT